MGKSGYQFSISNDEEKAAELLEKLAMVDFTIYG